jgi:hypothetical protein
MIERSFAKGGHRAVEAKIARLDQHTDAFELVGGRLPSLTSPNGFWHCSPNVDHDIAYYFSALAEFMCQSDVAQPQASSHRVDQPVA